MPFDEETKQNGRLRSRSPASGSSPASEQMRVPAGTQRRASHCLRNSHMRQPCTTRYPRRVDPGVRAALPSALPRPESMLLEPSARVSMCGFDAIQTDHPHLAAFTCFAQHVPQPPSPEHIQCSTPMSQVGLYLSIPWIISS